MPKAKPISLHHLSFDEALTMLIKAQPKPQKRRATPKMKKHDKSSARP